MPSELLTYLEINRIAERACNRDLSPYAACEWAIQEALRMVANRAATAVEWIEIDDGTLRIGSFAFENCDLTGIGRSYEPVVERMRAAVKAMNAVALAPEKEKGRGNA